MKTKFNLLNKLVMLFLMFASSVFSQPYLGIPTGGIFKIRHQISINPFITGDNYLTITQSTGEVKIFKTLRLENTTDSTTGLIYKGNERFLHNFGSANTFLGINSGNFTMSGFENTALGWNAFSSNTIGRYNTAVGNVALYFNTTGDQNTAIGLATLYYNTSGAQNTALGNQSLHFNTTGSDNTALGYSSLLFNTTGFRNTAVGSASLIYNSTGIENTAVGIFSLGVNTIGSQNTALGLESLSHNTTGNKNTALGNISGSSIQSGINLTCIGNNAQPTSSSAQNQITLGDADVSSLRCNVQSISSLSDERDKKNISDLPLGLDFLMKVKPRLFYWDKREWYESNTSDGSKMKEIPTAGFIAQELDEVQTTENAEWLNLVLKDNPEKLEATYGNLLPVMVKAIQELKSENDELKNEVEQLKTVNEKIVKLEQIVNELTSVKHTSLTESEVNLTNSK